MATDPSDVVHVPDHVKKQIAARPGIGLELCLSCNVQAKMIVGSFDAHHFREWWRVEGPVVVPCVSVNNFPCVIHASIGGEGRA